MNKKGQREVVREVPKDPWAITGEAIPEMFPTRMAFLKTVVLGIGITMAIFGILSLLIIKS